MGDSYDGKVVWITGGGSGIGKALALEVAGQGARVAVSGRRQAKLQEVVALISAAGGEAIAVVCDVTDDASVAAAVGQVMDGFGQLDVAVANAGCGVSGRFEKLDSAAWRRQMDINVIGLATTVREALPHLKASKGRIVLVSSVMGMMTIPGNAAYSASKFAVRAIGLTLSQELAGSATSCTTVYPGLVESEIAQVDNSGEFLVDRQDPRPKKVMWPADRAAKVMARAILKRKREFVFTKHGKVGAWMGRHTPGLVHLVMSKSAKKALKSSKA